MLTSLEIKNFRTFSHLYVERLGRVNLIVGKNNVGKTTLLEALRLYGSIWPPDTVGSILDERNEVGRRPDGQRVVLLHSLFHGRDPRKDDVIVIGEVGAGESAFRATADFEIEPGEQAGESMTAGHLSVGESRVRMESGPFRFYLYANGRWAYQIPGRWKEPEPPFDPPCLRSVGLRHATEDTIAAWWDALSLTDAEDQVLDSLQLIAPIRGIRFVGDPRSDGKRIAVAGIEGLDERVAIATLGDGLVRLFQLAVAFEYTAAYVKNASEAEGRPNVLPALLIDEVESGIHHTLHADLWRFIFRTAQRLDVQVFATSHSWDCMKGFTEAVGEDERNNGLAIRLETVKGEKQTGAVIIDRDDLPIVIRDSIEVR